MGGMLPFAMSIWNEQLAHPRRSQEVIVRAGAYQKPSHEMQRQISRRPLSPSNLRASPIDCRSF